MIKRILTILQVVFGASVVLRLASGANRQPVVTARDGAKVNTTSVSVVIPARNEAHRIGPCLEGLVDEPIEEILVIDDGSTDDTAGVALANGAKVEQAPELPDGWVGKPWALQHGLQKAGSEWVLFLDADTRPHAGLVKAAIARATSSDVHLLSLSARFRTTTALQQSMHASFLSGLVYRFGAIGSNRQPTIERTLISGQCMLVKREWLQGQGGFELVAGNMTDDIALAHALARRGARVGFLDGSDLIDVEMYQSAEETWNEWARSLPMNDVLSMRTRVLDIAMLWLTQGLPVSRLALGKSTVVDKVLLAMRFALLIPLTRAFERPTLAMLLSPFFDPAAVARLTVGVAKPNRSWRGRTYEQPGTANR